VFHVAREAPHLSTEGSYPLKDAASAGKLASALGKMDRAATQAWCEAYLGASALYEYAGKKETVGKLGAVRCTMTVRKEGAPETEAATKLLGKTVDTYLAVSGTRLLFAGGAGARSRLGALVTAKPRAPQGPMAEALAASTGREAFVYIDLAPVVAAAATYMQDPRAASMGRGQAQAIPIFGTFGGDGAGKAWTVDLTLPPSAFVAAGALIQKMGGAGGGGIYMK